ncbi:ATP-grasp domain-containing protein [Actinospica durhamensis]|uniref:ATP-grasp domain-containing protein n=1 Tax=Actinospica durhamensis TaxID=1508375 RepID=A0A941EP79_9ACTN|nr:ATP-grasp domain-containing protein [Actinospica durhamensis]MBR7834651.1 ATP-grasp domain-containing protein [Actinospica durhamensis]
MNGTSSITHVLAGFSVAWIGHLDRLLPAGSLAVVDEPEIIERRRIGERVAPFRCVGAVIAAPTQDEAGAEGLADVVSRPEGVRVVMPGVEYGVVAAAALAHAWGVPGAGLSAARTLRDKSELRRAGERVGLPQPAWRVVEGPEDLARFRDGLGTREYVLKPTNRQASLGVQLLGPQDDVAQAWRIAVEAQEPFLRAGYAQAARYQAEERLHGPEVSVEALVRAGDVVFFNITAKQVQPGRHPVESGHSVPAAVSPEADRALRHRMRDLIAATEFHSGVLHAEWILVGDVEPHLIECAGRLPGDGIVELIDLAYGGDLLADLLHVLDVDGGDGRGPNGSSRPGLERRARRGAAVRFLSSAPGRVAAVDGVDAAGNAEGVHSVQVDVAEGTVVGEVTSSWSRAGEVVATGADAAEAVRNTERAAALVEIVTAAPAAAAAATDGTA